MLLRFGVCFPDGLTAPVLKREPGSVYKGIRSSSRGRAIYQSLTERRLLLGNTVYPRPLELFKYEYKKKKTVKKHPGLQATFKGYYQENCNSSHVLHM